MGKRKKSGRRCRKKSGGESPLKTKQTLCIGRKVGEKERKQKIFHKQKPTPTQTPATCVRRRLRGGPGIRKKHTCESGARVNQKKKRMPGTLHERSTEKRRKKRGPIEKKKLSWRGGLWTGRNWHLARKKRTKKWAGNFSWLKESSMNTEKDGQTAPSPEQTRKHQDVHETNGKRGWSQF